MHVPAATGRYRPGKTPTMATLGKKRKALRSGTPARPIGSKPSRLGSGRGLRMAIHYPDGTKTMIRHMSEAPSDVCLMRGTDGDWYHFDGIELDPAVVLADAGEGKKAVWIQVAKPGHFFKGDHFELNDRVFSDIIANFEATRNHEVPVDFEHATEQSPSEGNIAAVGAPAQGWVRELRMQGGNLYGLVEWGDLAREYIKAKKYKYISPAIVLNARDRNTGKPIGARLTSVALTNKPFLDGMMPVAAKDSTMDQSTTMADRACMSAAQYMPRIKQALRTHDLATPQELAEHIDRLREHLDAVDGDAFAQRMGLNLGDFMNPLRDIANPSADATAYDVLDIIEKLVKWGYGEHIEENDGDPTAEMSDSETSTEELTMSASNELTVQLTEAKASVLTLTSQLEAEKATSAKLELQLNDAVSKVDAAAKALTEKDAAIAALTSEKAELSKQLKDRDEKDIDNRVAEAFETYKDSKKLTDANKKSMRITLVHDAATFEELYPRVNPGKQHLLRDLTGSGADGGKPRGAEPPKVTMTEGGEKVLKLSDLAELYQKQIGCDYGTALIIAEQKLKEARASK